MLTPFRKITLIVDDVEVAAPSVAVFERQEMANGKPRLLITAPSTKPNVFRELVGCLADPTFCIHREVKGLLVGIRARHLMADRLTISSPISLRTWQATPDTTPGCIQPATVAL
jgi:hypothetical protein